MQNNYFKWILTQDYIYVQNKRKTNISSLPVAWLLVLVLELFCLKVLLLGIKMIMSGREANKWLKISSYANY